MKRFIPLLSSLLILASCVSYTLTVPQTEVNAKVKKVFPVKKRYSLAEVVLKNPQVNLLNGNRGEVKLSYVLNLAGVKKIKGSLDAIGRFEYDPKSATVYLTGLEVKGIKLGGKEFNARKWSSLIERLLGEKLYRIPVYTIKGSKAKLVKGVEVKNGKLLIKLGM
ncbi:DUF1439 domain-containing protein [Thermovibrio ammonificans]|jgi:hypothetical protein|uniref:DUF1439 domain-containing protein n=1 Tax=Thermovibrio ammonificans (strain DSM 15698 / JCM 12110 / HB-1) TaxID=648996 RepID=E8T4F0_THEA1|nr:DUF1439 domain-containing protein [Thermovibrio ammonificans]ADU96285.1 hypothetical protein Theam_0312 [Thermovibrio ammonificans HB-1]